LEVHIHHGAPHEVRCSRRRPQRGERVVTLQESFGVRFGLVLALLSPVGCSSRTDPKADAHEGVPREPPRPARTIPLIDDRQPTVDGVNAATKRQALIAYLWGDAGFPPSLASVEHRVDSPIPNLGNLRSVDRLRIPMEGGESNLTFHFVAERSNGRLVVV